VRILVSCLQGPAGYPIPAYDFWRIYFKNGIQEAGHQFVEVEGADWAKALTLSDGEERAAWRSRTWQQTLDFIRREHASCPIDLFLSYFFPRHVDASAVSEIKQLGIPCVNFFCDNVREFRAIPKEFAVFDLHWVPETDALGMYRAAGFPHTWLPMPCWVPQEFRLISSEESERPIFIGRGDLMRQELFGRAFRAGADFQIRGVGWQPDSAPNGTASASRSGSMRNAATNQLELYKTHGAVGLYCKLLNKLVPLEAVDIPANRIGPPVSNADYFRLTREAKVSLGVSRVPTPWRLNRRPLTYSRLRDLEAPMLGACYLTEWSPDLERLYDVGEEIEAYRSPEELAAKLEQLLRTPGRRKALRAKGQRRALETHSIANSIRKIISILDR
jgi:hypothetical protein